MSHRLCSTCALLGLLLSFLNYVIKFVRADLLVRIFGYVLFCHSIVHFTIFDEMFYANWFLDISRTLARSEWKPPAFRAISVVDIRPLCLIISCRKVCLVYAPWMVHILSRKNNSVNGGVEGLKLKYTHPFIQKLNGEYRLQLSCDSLASLG